METQAKLVDEMKIRTILLLTLSLVTLHAQKTFNAEILNRIPERMKAFTDDRTVAGVVTLIAHKDKIVQHEAVGMADIEAGHPMQKDTIFQIMSMTKPVTGLGIMMLAEEGKLTLRDPIDRILPEFHDQRVATNTGPDSGRLGALLRPITVADLMTHTSGMPDSPPNEIKGYSQQMNVPLAEVVRVFARQPLLFQPGTKWSYSSPGIDILGRIIEVCSGQKYEDFIQQRILTPLGMKDSFFYPKPEQIARIAMVYENHNGKLTPSPGTILGGDPAAHRKGAVYPAPSWGLYSTAEDLQHFYQMMVNGGTLNGHRYLSKFSVNLMTEIHTGEIIPSGWLGGGAYGLTWEVVKDPWGELVGHTKGTYGHGGAFGTQGWIDPSNGLIRIMLIQRSNGGSDSLRNTFMTMAEAALN
jgi:CubicO group peptidase (beta-lactamase class C family)